MKQQEKIAEKQAQSERRASEQNQFFDEWRAKEAALLRGSDVMSRLKQYCGYRQIFEKKPLLTEAEFQKFMQISADEQEWKSLLLASVIDDKLITYPEDLTSEELRQFIFMQQGEEGEWRDRLAKRKPQSSQDIVTDLGKAATDALPDQHRARVRVRKSYVNPAREDKVMVGVHVMPALKDALKKKFEQSGFENFNDFLAAGLQSLIQEPTQEFKPSAELVASALTQSRNLEKTISLLSQDVSTRLSKESPVRSR